MTDTPQLQTSLQELTDRYVGDTITQLNEPEWERIPIELTRDEADLWELTGIPPKSVRDWCIKHWGARGCRCEVALR
jgi:hypothetical protein